MTDTAAITYVLDDQVGFLLRLASQRHAALFQARMPKGITPNQFSALIRLADNPGCSQNRLGRLAGMDGATIKGVVDRLRDKGLARSTPDTDDKRRSTIQLTQNGAALIAGLQRPGGAVSDDTLAPLKATERETLIRLLREIA